ncbi:hypothetical protein [Streptomyces sp. NPDC058382]|uniref:hypothetical protein n=1 Tax=unclassified Streptomyces TaxID=2593676 RepID=UPI003625E317
MPADNDNRSFTVADGVEVPVAAPGTAWTVGAVVLNRDGAAFAQRRGPEWSKHSALGWLGPDDLDRLKATGPPASS